MDTSVEMGDVKLEKVKLTSGRQLCFIGASDVQRNLTERGYANDSQLRDTAHSDLSPGVYEGGLKIWEGAIDLCNYLDNPTSEVNLKDKAVLEVGCGAALPAILSILKGASHVTVQDFNQSVIDCFTKDNFAVNGVDVNKYRLFAGDWLDFQRDHLDSSKYDLILTAETIYNEEMYGRLHDLIDVCLTDTGVVLLAAKVYYFGVGGSIASFLDFVNKRGVFEWRSVWSSCTSVPRKILLLSRKGA